METDTIAAIATALSPSGIGIIRISGTNAVPVANAIFSSNQISNLCEVPSHTIHYGYIYDDEEMIDEVMLAVMLAPHSFTREDTVEIDCHGGVYVMQKILETVIKHGARLAEPGEFTKRAFLNGRIDLTKAEAVMDLIQSKNEYALKSSLAGLRGSLYEKISNIRQELLYEIARIESALDDPEHMSLEGYVETLRVKTKDLLSELRILYHTADDGRLKREGIKTVIVGKPNAGKSSLLNYLAGQERAIVTDIAGTTRDTLEETIIMDEVILNVVDTAGIRFTEDKIEQIGVCRAKEAIEEADLILYMMDSSVQTDDNDQEICRIIADKKTIVLMNKSDLQPSVNIEEVTNRFSHVISISAKTGSGIKEFIDCVKELFFSGEIAYHEEVMLTNMRQKSAVSEAMQSLESVLSSLDQQMPEDFYSIDLMGAYASLGNLIGEEVGEDLVEEIFSKFCMGK